MTQKHFFLLLFAMLIINRSLFAQTIERNTQRQSVKEDGTNYYRSEDINQLDILEALDFAGIKINKFNIGDFDTTHDITFIIEEFQNSKLKKTDTVFSRNNLYGFFKGEKKYNDYIDEIKIISRQERGICNGKIKTYVGSDGFRLICDTSVKFRSYNWRSFTNPTWKLNKKILLMVYASTWTDKENGVERFCGAMELKENDEDSKALLSKSPHYYLFSYIVTN